MVSLIANSTMDHQKRPSHFRGLKSQVPEGFVGTPYPFTSLLTNRLLLWSSLFKTLKRTWSGCGYPCSSRRMRSSPSQLHQEPWILEIFARSWWKMLCFFLPTSPQLHQQTKPLFLYLPLLWCFPHQNWRETHDQPNHRTSIRKPPIGLTQLADTWVSKWLLAWGLCP